MSIYSMIFLIPSPTRDALSGALYGCVNDYKIDRYNFRNEAHKGHIAGLKFVSAC